MRDVAVGILVREKLVLACQRPSSARYPLKWEFPGGKVEPGETPREALDRELREELAIRVVQANPFHLREWTYPDSAVGKEDGAFRVHYFTVSAFEGDPTNHAFAEIRWVTIAQLSSLDILEGNADAVKLLSRTLNSGRATP